MPISKNVTIIEWLVNEIIECNVVKRIILIINEDRGNLISKLSKFKDLVEIIYIYQKNNSYSEYLCAMKNAESLMFDYNILLLPDTYIDGLSSLIKQGIDFMDYTSEPLVMLAKKEKNLHIIKKEGALKLNEYNKVIEIKEKPSLLEAKKFNAFWVSYIFKSVYLNEILDLFSFSYNYSDFFPISCFFTGYACDLGDWNRLYNFYGMRYKDE